MTYGPSLMVLGLALAALGGIHRGWLWLLVWLGADTCILGIAYARGAHRVFGKRPDGSLAAWSWPVFLPWFLGKAAVWHALRWFSGEPACHRVTDRLVVGRRLLASELPGEFDNYVDLAAEFSEPPPVRRLRSYRCFPILDGATPAPAALRAAIGSLRPGRTYVHCAQGHGRAALFALAVLLDSGAAPTVEQGWRTLRAARPRVCLNRAQWRFIEAYAARGAVGEHRRAESHVP